MSAAKVAKGDDDTIIPSDTIKAWLKDTSAITPAQPPITRSIQGTPFTAAMYLGLINGFVLHYVSEAYQLSHRTALRAWLMLAPVLLAAHHRVEQ